MKVYSVEEIVDLGNHVIHLFLTKEKAEYICKKMNDEMQEKIIKDRIYFETYEYEVEE